MTRKEKIALLIDELGDIRCNNFDADTDEDKTLKEAVRVIKALEQEPKWIPVSDRLPNLDDYTGSQVWQKEVLITGYLSFDDKKGPFVSEAFAKDVICNCVPNTVVIAWMPLPLPYKPD